MKNLQDSIRKTAKTLALASILSTSSCSIIQDKLGIMPSETNYLPSNSIVLSSKKSSDYSHSEEAKTPLAYNEVSNTQTIKFPRIPRK